MSEIAIECEAELALAKFNALDFERNRILEGLHVLVERAKRAGHVAWGATDKQAARILADKNLLARVDRVLLDWAIPDVFSRPIGSRGVHLKEACHE